MKVLIITGTPGTGKTTLSVELAKELDFHYIDVNKIVIKYKLSESYDGKRKTKVIDVKKLNKALIKEISYIKNNKKLKKTKSGIIIDSHLSHYLPMKYVDLCIVTKCDMKILKNRLKKKKYSEDKIRENLDAEIFDICLSEAKESKQNIYIIDTTKGINMGKILNKIKVR